MSLRSFDSPNHDDCPKFRVRHIATYIHAQERRTYTSQCNFGNLIHISCMRERGFHLLATTAASIIRDMGVCENLAKG